MITEKTSVSFFNILPSGIINLNLLTSVSKDEVVIASSVQQITLQVNDSSVDSILGFDNFYLGIAKYVWQNLPN